MKKKMLQALAIIAVMAFVSCDSKLCYCYQATAGGVYEEEVYVNNDTPCSAMGNDKRGCVEANERMNPNEVAYK